MPEETKSVKRPSRLAAALGQIEVEEPGVRIVQVLVGRLGEVDQFGVQMHVHRRLELARHMLRETRLPLKEIAFELGFSSPAHFSNWFRGRLQTTPTAFRNQSAPETPMPMRVMPKS